MDRQTNHQHQATSGWAPEHGNDNGNGTSRGGIIFGYGRGGSLGFDGSGPGLSGSGRGPPAGSGYAAEGQGPGSAGVDPALLLAGNSHLAGSLSPLSAVSDAHTPATTADFYTTAASSMASPAYSHLDDLYPLGSLSLGDYASSQPVQQYSLGPSADEPAPSIAYSPALDMSSGNMPARSPALSHHSYTIPTSDPAPISGDSSVRQGLPPDARAPLNQHDIPTLQEQERQREQSHTISEVSSWLKTTTNDAPTAGALPRNMDPKEAYQQRRQQQDRSGSPESQRSYDAGVDAEGDAEADSDDEELGDCPPTPPQSHAHVQKSRLDAKVRPPLESSRRHSSFYGNWKKTLSDPETGSIKDLPDSSTAAMERFQRRARDMETVSIAATYAPSRHSIAESAFSGFSTRQASIAMPRMPGMTTVGINEPVGRRVSLRSRISRTLTRADRKRKDDKKRPSIDGKRSDGKRGSDSSTWQGSDSSLPGAAMAMLDAARLAAPSSAHPPRPRSIFPLRKSRSRSRSDVGASSSSGSALAAQWASAGGPPVPALAADSAPEPAASPATLTPGHLEIEAALSQVSAELQRVATDDEDDDRLDDELSVALVVPAAATPDGFRHHILQVAPRTEPFLVDRIVHEQVQRYARLVDVREQHARDAADGACKSKHFCVAAGRGPQTLKPRRKGRAKDSASPIYKVLASMPDEHLDHLEPGEVPQQATFPYGIPLPPIKQFPAEFECPICFRVRRIHKPSDWSKHCYEDLHPFTCSFAACAQPKSFNRKADWTRHENESHRHLEGWICNIDACAHTCHRRDNYIQHLARVHNIEEPKGQQGRRRNGDEQGRVGQLVAECHAVFDKDPALEACRFCGNTYGSWKELVSHLAKHMTQIGLPLLVLVGRGRPGDGEGADLPAAEAALTKAASAQAASLRPTSHATARAKSKARASTLMAAQKPAQHRPSGARQTPFSYPGTKNLPRSGTDMQPGAGAGFDHAMVGSPEPGRLALPGLAHVPNVQVHGPAGELRSLGGLDMGGLGDMGGSYSPWDLASDLGASDAGDDFMSGLPAESSYAYASGPFDNANQHLSSGSHPMIYGDGAFLQSTGQTEQAQQASGTGDFWYHHGMISTVNAGASNDADKMHMDMDSGAAPFSITR